MKAKIKNPMIAYVLMRMAEIKIMDVASAG
jgi:hypothetical protein